MILIGGTKLSAEALPFSDILEYVVESDPSVLAIKLKTVAKSSTCLGVYLHLDFQNISLTEDVAEKTIYFNDDDHLMKLLESDNSSKEDEDQQQPEVEEDDEVKVFSVHSVNPNQEDIQAFEPSKLEIEEVDTELPETLLSIPNISDDVDSLHQQLENKNRIIEQQNGMINDLKAQINDIYKLQERQLMEMKEMYEKQIDEAQSIIDDLTRKLKEASIPPEMQGFLKFATYSQNYKAALKEGFTEEELSIIGRKTSNIYILASGAGDSLHTMLKNIKALMDKKPNALFVDFSNDYFMNARYRIQSKDSSMLLNDDSIEVQSLVRDANGTRLIPTTVYNDIALLSMNWAKVLKKLMVYAGGKPIILIFNSINSFSVRYTVSKLATIGQLFIFAKCNPVILSTLFGDLAFIPENRFKVVATDYIDVVKAILEQIGKKYNVHIFKGDVNWSKIGVNL